jgi:hypothetical protein
MAKIPQGIRGAAGSISSMEHNNHLQGRSGGATKVHKGPAYSKGKGDLGNSSDGGGINRPTKKSSPM